MIPVQNFSHDHEPLTPLCIANLVISELDKNGAKTRALWQMNECDCGETFDHPRAFDYRGKQNITRTGLTCQNWNIESPNYHALGLAYEYTGLGDHYNCRNPDGAQCEKNLKNIGPN